MSLVSNDLGSPTGFLSLEADTASHCELIKTGHVFFSYLAGGGAEPISENLLVSICSVSLKEKTFICKYRKIELVDRVHHLPIHSHGL